MAQRPKSDGRCHEDCLVARAVAGLSIGLVLVNPGRRVVWLNRAAETILGVSRDECVGRPMEQSLSDPQLSAFWQDSLANGDQRMAELSVRWPQVMELKASTTRCLDDAGSEIGRALLICDVSNERKVQVELSRAVATRLMDLTSGHMPPQPVAHLTQQELRVLRMVGRGLGNEQIAASAEVSASTVRSHLKSLYRKLGLSSRTEAVSFAVRHHLV